ncbi:MAG TPA: GDSL-type esterase/lipase family protein, partial [Kineosporiaceae bacterium]|nr:GDSL-type esterase/lipase family protein [Kineosporiaceae bacterium]
AATAFTESTQSAIYWLTALDVYRPASTGAVVVLGDSITQGVGSTTDANTSWVARLSAQQAGLPAADDAPSVVNAGIAGNMACDDSESWGPGGTARLDRDVLGQTDARTVLLFLGTNDIAFGGGPTYPGLTSSQVITCLTSIAKSAHAAGLRVVGATSIPRSFTGDRETYRTALNTWVRTTGALDGYVDFDAAVRSATDPTKIATSYDSDGVHPNDAGHQAMANAVDTALLGTGESVLGDGGLESGELGVWSQYPSGTATVGTTGVHSGSKALAIADPNAGVWRTLTTLKPNTTYTLAGWLSRSSGPGDYLFVKVDGVEARSAESSSASPAYASVTFTTGATGTATVGVWRTTGAGGTAHADDLALVRASANPVPDPGFESGALGGWTASASNAATVGTTGVHGGSKALTITGANAGVYRTVTGLRANTSYTWSGWLSRSSAAGSIWLCANGGGTTLNSAMVTSASPQLVAVTATSDASGSLTLCAWAYDPSTSVTGYVDDVRLARTS